MFRFTSLRAGTVFLIALSCAAFHAPATAALNDTGQTLCYDGGAMVACAVANSGNTSTYPRQDGRFGRDAAQMVGQLLPAKTGGGAAGFDFSKVCNNGGDCSAQGAPGPNPADWGCTRDNVTGLLWRVQDDGAMDWSAATATGVASPITIANAANLCGVSNWRVPKRRELISLLNEGKASAPQIDTGYFPGTPSALFWAAETLASAPTHAWYVDFGASATLNINGSLKTTNTNHLRLVSGTPLPESALIDNGDGTVSDSTTGLMWDKCVLGRSGAGCSTGAVLARSWDQALQAVVTANNPTANPSPYLGYRDWRLPNRNEMESLVDLTLVDQTSNPMLPNMPGSTWFWTSTTFAPAASTAWMIASAYGDARNYDKTYGSTYVRLVRGGPTNSEAYDPQAMNVDVSITPSTSSASITFSNASDNGTLYAALFPAGDPAPDFTQVLTGISVTLSAGGSQSRTPILLTSGTTYTLYFFTENASGVFGPLQTYSFTTTSTPVLSAQSLTGITQTGATFGVTSNLAATAYWVVLPAAAAAPNASQIVAGAGSNTGSMSAATAFSRTLTGLTSNTAYKLYFVADSGSGTYSSVWNYAFTTSATLTAGISAADITADSATLNGQADMANSTGYWMLFTGGSTAPTIAEMINGDSSLLSGFIAYYRGISMPVANVPVPFVLLPGHLTPNTTYDAYFVATNGAQQSARMQTSFTTLSIVPPPDEGDGTSTSRQTHAQVKTENDLQTINGVFVPSRVDRGQAGSVFVFAWLKENVTLAPNTVWVLDSGGNWHQFTDCRMAPAVVTGNLQMLDNIAIFPEGVDLSPFAGSELYIGYGLGGYAQASGAACNDMLIRENWVKVYTQPGQPRQP